MVMGVGGWVPKEWAGQEVRRLQGGSGGRRRLRRPRCGRFTPAQLTGKTIPAHDHLKLRLCYRKRGK
ncbi:hypothetical protein E2C01_052385 [Portunus trituberculatus]|uniref:Uncharacterized protein n=1 Tax=Portunus trituberculatus TaxID=210409 RepID=A0A5B7GEF2_PORTR|nr:hypothetical protein [Portunus trituberculatus]